MSDRDTDLQRVQEAINMLTEHFDSIQIFVTRYEPTIEDGTVNIHQGVGNWFTRKGQVDEWVAKHNARIYKEIKNES